MRNLLVFILFFTFFANATSPAYKIKAKNPVCQLELEELKSKYTSHLSFIYPDVEINLVAEKLMILRKTALVEGAIETQRQIDSMIASQLIDTINNMNKSNSFLPALTKIKNELSVTPLLVSEDQREELNLLFKTLGI